MIARARAPLRLGLAGGGTDLSPFCDEYGGAILNATITQYAHAALETGPPGKVEFAAADLDAALTMDLAPRLPLDEPLVLHKAVYNRLVTEFLGGEAVPLKLTTYTDVPAGSGLGSSSALVVAILEAFREFFNLPLDRYELAHLAYEIERNDAGMAGGRQDQYAAAFGGVNFIEFFDDERVIVNPLRVPEHTLNELEVSLVLYFTGVSRRSSAIIGQQAENMRRHDRASIEAMLQLKQDAVAMKEAFLRGRVPDIGEIMRQSWAAKKRTANAIATGETERIFELAMRHGATAGKISGAGGGGFMMFFIEPLRRHELFRALHLEPGSVRTCHFTERGVEAWRVGQN